MATNPPYRKESKSGGLFALVGTGQPISDDESKLAKMLTQALSKATAEPNAMAQYIGPFGEIAELGLTGASRDVAAALQNLRSLGLRLFDDTQRSNGPQTPPPAAAFAVKRGANFTIEIERTSDGPEPTEDQIDFASDLDRQERLIKTLYLRAEPDARKRERAVSRAVDRLVFAGQLALQARPNVRLGRLAVQSALSDGLAEYGMTIRHGYLSALAHAYLGWVVVGIVTAAAYGIAIRQVLPPSSVPRELVLPNVMLALLTIAMIALSFGAWLSALQRVKPDSPEVIGSIVNETLTASLRAVYVLGFGFIALLMLHKKAVVFAIGATGDAGVFSTASVLTQLSSAVLTGALLGIGERTLPDAVVQSSAKLMAAIAQK